MKTAREQRQNAAELSAAPLASTVSARRSPSPERPLPAPPRARHQTRGRELLRARPESSAELARMIGASRATVSAWRVGAKQPNATARAVLEAHAGIPAAAWGEVAREPRAGPLAAVRAPDSLAATGDVAEVADLIAAVREARRDPGLLASERIRAAAEERALLALRSRLEHQAATCEAAIERLCIEHPKWQAFKLAMVAALKPHREAAAALNEVFRAFGVEVPPHVY